MIQTPALAEGVCPDAPDISAATAPLLEQIKRAPDERSAQMLTNEMWALWSTAPDAQAQALLDEGMERREAYDYEAAAAALDRLVAYCPAYAEGYNQRAFVAFLRGNFAEAVPDLERALELNPTHFAARAGLGLTLYSLGRRAAAEGMLRTALELNPWLPERRMLPQIPGQEL